MVYPSAILNIVDPRIRSDFIRFCNTGEADDWFLERLDRDKELRDAVDSVIFGQMEKLSCTQ